MPSTETVAIRFTECEHSLIEGVAALYGTTASDLVGELIGFERHDEPSAKRHVELVPTRRAGRQEAACLP